MSFSVIIPTFNEIRHGYLEKILNFWSKYKDQVEIIVVDSGSVDETLKLVDDFPYVKVIKTKKANRPGRLNEGAKIAGGNILLFHHPVSLIDEEAVGSFLKLNKDFVWGAFEHKFDKDHWLLRFTSWYSNRIRGKLKQIFYLDHCLVVQQDIHFMAGGWPEDDIFEDTIYSNNLSKFGKPELLDGISTTSARRFNKRGIYKHAFLNQIIKLMFIFGVDKKKINLLYEGKNPFNVRY